MLGVGVKRWVSVIGLVGVWRIDRDCDVVCAVTVFVNDSVARVLLWDCVTVGTVNDRDARVPVSVTERVGSELVLVGSFVAENVRVSVS
jgi:hypothetical protein